MNNNTQNSSISPVKLGFALDIDSTLVISHQQIPGSSQALNLLTRNNIPWILVTNNISKSEQTKADQLNKLFKLDVPITADQIILNITPLKKYTNWKEKTVLIVMRENQECERLPIQEIPFYITINEYCTIFPNTVPLSRRKKDQNYEFVKKTVETRLGVQNLNQNQINIGAILILNCPLRWQESYQVIMDLLSCQQGSLRSVTEYKYVENHIPILTALNDMFFKTKFHPLPRILVKPFNEGLKSIYKQIYGKELQMINFGKPQKNTFTFIDQFMTNKFGKVEKIVMIGDNEDTDILGAYNYGWESVLVTTGISKQISKRATFTCDNVLSALEKYGIIRQKENDC